MPIKSTSRLEITHSAALSALMLFGSAIAVRGAAQTTMPATQANPIKADALTADVEKQFGLIQNVLGDESKITDQAKRAQAAPTVIPVLKTLANDFDQLIAVAPDYRDEATDRRAQMLMYLSLFGDAEAAQKLSTEASSADANPALEGQRSQLMVGWLSAAQSPETQAGIFDQMQKLATAHPKSNALALQLVHMSQMGASSPALKKQLISTVAELMKNEVGDAVRMELDGEKTQRDANRKLTNTLQNKPITIAGRQPDGSKFTTDAWKGKVILVDFWATWCGPCREELPKVEKLYADYHDKGFEVVGVSNDYAATDLISFQKSNPMMPWPQLFDPQTAKTQDLNPITQGYGINGIPTLFLIDRKSNLQMVGGLDDVENLIPKLLDEK